MEENAVVNPIRISDEKSGKVYELDFDRAAVAFAEDHEFILEDVTKYPETKFKEFFYYAFRMHHRDVSRGQTNAIYDRLGGFSAEFLERLASLYRQAQLSNNVVSTTADMGKNGGMTVEL